MFAFAVFLSNMCTSFMFEFNDSFLFDICVCCFLLLKVDCSQAEFQTHLCFLSIFVFDMFIFEDECSLN